MKFYITTAIDYANNSPHIGHALEKIQADVLARYHRNRKEKVFFLTGTDEHGTKNLRAAQSLKMDTQNFVDKIAEDFKSLKKLLNLSWDKFIRTTDRENHWHGVFKLWRALKQNGDIYKRSYQGLYCVGCEAFLTEKDLVNGKCPDHLKEPEIIEEENYFFRLSEYGNRIKEKILNDEIKIVPAGRKHEILSLINGGLEDISVSRSRERAPWGIPVPDDDTQTIYVWIDALPNYLTGIGFGRDNKESREQFHEFWPVDVHLIGKDILKFHALIWPAILMSIELPLPKSIYTHGWITVNGQKMSKTIGNVISPGDLAVKYGTDAVRYYLLREIPSTEDGDFSEEKFKERYNGELANGLGNFTARVLTLASKNYPEILATEIDNPEENLWQKIKETEKKINKKIN